MRVIRSHSYLDLYQPSNTNQFIATGRRKSRHSKAIALLLQTQSCRIRCKFNMNLILSSLVFVWRKTNTISVLTDKYEYFSYRIVLYFDIDIDHI